MARKDEIYKSFLNHELILNKYKIKKEDMPQNLRAGLSSKITILKAIALIVEDAESNHPSTEKSLYGKITQFLNESSI